MKKKKLEELQDRLNELAIEMDKLEPARSRYYELSFERVKLNDEYGKLKNQKELNELISKTKYVEPEYPSMGSEAINGYATFQNKEDAEKLQKMLIHRSYYYGYLLEWGGPGDYIVEPDWKYDQDREVIYTATFRKIK